MATVKAKFKVYQHKIIRDAHGESTNVLMHAVTDAKNESWSKWTPSGSIEMHITNPAALDVLKPGKEFFLTFDEACASSDCDQASAHDSPCGKTA